MLADRTTVQNILAVAVADGRTALLAHEAAQVCDAYGIPVARQFLAESAQQAVRVADQLGFPVAMKIVSASILHKTEAGGIRLGLTDPDQVTRAYAELTEAARRHAADAPIAGILVQKMEAPAREVLVGGVTDPTFGKVVAFGLGGVLVEVIRDVTFRMTPVDAGQAASMLDDIAAADVLRGVRGQAPVDRAALVGILEAVSRLLEDFPQIEELDLNPIFARESGAVAVDARITIATAAAARPPRYAREDIVASMRRIMHPCAVAVIGASAEEGKIGNSVMKNLVAGGYRGAIYPIHPKAEEIMGLRCHRSVLDVEGPIDVAVFAIPARLVAGAMEEVGRKGIAGAVLIPSGFAETGEKELQDQVMEVARRHAVRVMGPNIYGFYYTPENLCATFCTAYDVRGKVALSSQSGGVGMSIIGFSRSSKMGVSAIVGLGNKADIDEDDLLEFFEQDENTSVIAMHAEDLKDGRAFAETARRVSRTKPVVMLKAGRTALGARAAASHTGALAGNDKVYDDVLRQCGVVRAKSLRDMLEFARGLSVLPAPRGENVVIVTGAGGSGVLLSDACVDNGLSLMRMPEDLDAAFRKFIPPFGAAGNPVDITGGEPPSTYRNTIALALEEERIHALVLGYWHTIVTPPMVFAELLSDVVEQARAKGIEKPVVASLVGDVEVERACEHLWSHGIPAYPYTTEIPVAVLGAKYRWARAAGLL